MEAGNFSIEELARLTALAHDKGVKVFLAFNSIIKEGELSKVSRILAKIVKYVPVDSIIIQDPAMIQMARDAGFEKQIHLSTLANCTHPAGLKAAWRAGISKVVLPREFTIDEIKSMAEAAPRGWIWKFSSTAPFATPCPGGAIGVPGSAANLPSGALRSAL